MFVFRYVRFVFDEARAAFLPLRPFDRATTQQLTDRLATGLAVSVQTKERERRGGNSNDVIVKPRVQIMVEEIFQPFFVFQIYSVS
jgi:hypothetical protein